MSSSYGANNTHTLSRQVTPLDLWQGNIFYNNTTAVRENGRTKIVQRASDARRYSIVLHIEPWNSLYYVLTYVDTSAQTCYVCCGVTSTKYDPVHSDQRKRKVVRLNMRYIDKNDIITRWRIMDYFL